MYPNYQHNFPPIADTVQNPATGTSGSQYHQAWNNQMHNNGQYGGQDYTQYASNQYWSGYMNNFNAPAFNPPPYEIPFEQIKPDNIKATLQDAKLWNSFHELDNEMVTLPTGRVIFPCLSYIISGLPQPATYIFGLKLRRLNKNTLEYKSGKWKEIRKCVKADLESNEIFTGSEEGKIVFKNAKIHTIRKKDNAKRKEDEKSTKRKRRAQVDLNEESSNSLLVTSHCRYIPVLSVYYVSSQQSKKLLKTFEIDETQFVALTSYKNDAVRKMKTNLNPFARPDYKKEIVKNLDESLVNSTLDSGISSMDNSMASSDMSPIPPKRSKSDVNFFHPDTSQNQYQFDGSIWNSSMISGPSHFLANQESNKNSFTNSSSLAAGSSSIHTGRDADIKPLQEHSRQPTHSYAPASPWTPIAPGQPNQPWMGNNSSLDFGQNHNYQF